MKRKRTATNRAERTRRTPGAGFPIVSRGHDQARKLVANVSVCLPYLVLIFIEVGHAGPLDTWMQRNPSPTANNLYAVAWGNGQFVAVGDAGTIVTSTDGTNWILQQSGTQLRLSGVAYGDGLYVAVGDAGTKLISGDGVSWAQYELGTQQYSSSIAFGDGRFVASGLTSMAYGNGQFVAAGSGGAISNSTDGINWEAQLPVQGPRVTELNAVAFANGRFVAVGYSASSLLGVEGTILTSVDGATWVGQGTGKEGLEEAIVYGDGKFVVVGVGPLVLTSADGESWGQHESPALNGYNPYNYGGGQLMAYGNGQFVLVGPSGTILTCTDGVNWLPLSLGNQNQLTAIAYGSGQFVAVGSDSGGGEDSILTSGDGAEWVRRHSGTTNGLGGVAFGNGQFVAIGGGGAILTSTNGVDWMQRDSRLTNDLSSIAYGNGRFVAVNGDNSILISTDLLNWVQGPPGPTNAPLSSVWYGNGEFEVIGNSSCWKCGRTVLMASSDGLNWSSNGREVELPSAFANALAYGNGQFVAVGFNPYEGSAVVADSVSGSSWAPHALSCENPLRGVAYGDGHFVAVGDYGTILQSGSILTLALTPNPLPGMWTLSLTGPTGASYTIQSSSDLVSWHDLTNVVGLQATTVVPSTFSVGSGNVFYRAWTR
jgi:hypothetical protein